LQVLFGNSLISSQVPHGTGGLRCGTYFYFGMMKHIHSTVIPAKAGAADHHRWAENHRRWAV